MNPAIQQLLAQRRDRFNTLYKKEKLKTPTLDDSAFMAHLHDTLIPVVEAVYAQVPEQAGAVLDALYTQSLHRIGAHLPGSAAHRPEVDTAWRKLLLTCPTWLAESSESLPSALASALNKLALKGSAVIQSWSESMTRYATAARTADEWLQAGRVAAWRAGMPNYRDPALKILKHMRPELASTLLELGTPLDESDWPVLLERLTAYPWLPTHKLAQAPSEYVFRPMTVIGGFVGLGGPFMTPPSVYRADNSLYAYDHDGTWRIHADIHGASFYKVTEPPVPDTGKPVFSVRRNGGLNHWNIQGRFKALARSSSHASCSHTLAVTHADSHCIVLAGWTSP